MLCALILTKRPKAPEISTRLNVSLFACATTVILMVWFGTWNGTLTVLQTAIYMTIGHLAWGVALLWIVLACHWGLISPVNKFLSYPGFLPLSRLSFCAYLFHPIIMLNTVFQMQSPINLQAGIIVSTR